MSLPAARATDQQTCPAWIGPANPHVGGPITSGESPALIGGAAPPAPPPPLPEPEPEEEE